jgi:hypothetical protein
MRSVTRSECRRRFEGKSVAIVGSGPGVLDNAPGFVDGHDIVVRVNNYKLSPSAGFRTDVFYSFFGTSIRKTREELIRDGVTLCMSKIPDADCSAVIPSDWHRRNGKMIGVDYRPHFERRSGMGFWFCDTYVPTIEEFLAFFRLLGDRQPTSGGAAIFDIVSFAPRALYLTGFDFFRSSLHNVNEQWHRKNADDPIGHDPERELAWLAAIWKLHPLIGDPVLTDALETALRGGSPFPRPAGRFARTG